MCQSCSCFEVTEYTHSIYDNISICRLQIDQNEHDISVLEGTLEKVRFLGSNHEFTCVVMTCLVV